MSADTRKKIYDILKNKTGFMDSYEDFDNDMTTSEDARKKVYEVLRDKTGFNDTYENFVSGISGEVQKESNIPTVKEESGNVVTTIQSPSYPQRAETKERILNNIPDYFRSRGNDLSTLPLPQNTMSAEKPADIPGRIVQDEQQRIQLAERSANDPYMKQQELEHVFKPKNQEQIDSVRQLINSARQQRVKERQQRVKSAGGGGIFSTMSQAYLSGEQNDADKQLEYASTLIEQAQNITNEAKKKGNTNFFSGFARGFKDAPLDGWAMGLQDLKNYSAAKKVMDKVDRGEELSPYEDALMQALVTNAATQMYYSGDLGRGYKAGGVTAESLPFMLDMIAGMGTIQSVTKPASKALVKYATEKAAKMGLGRATTGLAKGAARTAAGLGDVAAHTATFGGARVAADYQRRGLGDVQVSPEQDGTVSYAGRDNVQTGAEAIGKSVVSTAAETGSELLGEYFAPMLGWVGKVTGANRLGKIIPASVGKAYSSIINSNGFKQVQEIARRAKIADPIGEYGEEVVNNLVSTAIGDMTPEQLVDLDNNIDTFLGVAPMSALFGAAGTGKYVVNKFANYRNMKRFEEEMRETMGDDWSGVREALQDADIETAREMVKDVLRSGMQSDMKQKAIKYIATVLQEQTLQQVDMQMAPEQIVNEKKSIFKNLSDARKKINLTDEKLEEALYSSDLSMYDEQTERSIEEYRQAYNDYLNYTYWVQDQAYVARREAESQVERMTNATTGTVMRVKSGLSQNPVNILRGNIVFDAEGNVDKDSSDNTIYYLSEDGKVKMAPISMFESLVDDTPAEELAYQAGEDAEQEFIQAEEAQLMQPEQSVQPIELGTTFQKDGVTYVFSQKSPDGYVVSALDEEGNPVQSKLLTEEQIRTAMTPAIQEEQTSQEQFAQSEDVTQPEQQQVQTEPQTAISRIPVNENGEHDFESAPYQDTSSALIEISENVDDAKDTDTQMINHYQEELKKADKAKTTGNTIQEIVRLKQQKKANIQSINDKIAYWNSVANDIESKRPGGIIEQAKEESDANQQRLSEMTAEQQQAAQQEVQKKIDSGSYERKEPRKRARYVNEDNEMGTANTPMEHVLREIATGRVTFNWNDSGETQGLGSHLGLASSPEERRRMIWALSSDGMTPEAAAEQIHADMPETLQGMVTDQDVFNMILESFQQYGTPSKMWEAAKSMHGTDIEESAPGYEDYMEQQALEWEASQNNMTVEEWISYVDYVEEELDNMYSSVSDEDLNAIFEKFNEQIISENESRGNETESAGSTEGQTDGEQGDELLPEGRGNNEGADTTVNEQPEQANQTDGESGGVVPESEVGNGSTSDVERKETEQKQEGYNVEKRYHKKEGKEIYAVNFTKRMEREDFLSAKKKAKEAGGYYSSFGKGGFIFNTEDEAVNFANSIVSENKTGFQSSIETARQEVEQNPTEAQKEAGNYKKGHVKVDGFDITIENPKDSGRSGKDADGKEWSVTMNNDYGYIRGTEGVDGDHIDVFLSDNPESGDVFVIDQVNPDGTFDEHKVMYGFKSALAAKRAYMANYSKDWTGLGNITRVSKEEFKKWVNSSRRKTKPFAEYKNVKGETQKEEDGIRPDEGVLDYAKRVAEREQKKEYGSQNKVVSTERYEELRKRLRSKLNNLNAGYDPELLQIGAEMAAYHVEAGARKFVDFAKRMISDMGDNVSPYLKLFYNAVRDFPGMESYESEMTPYEEVRSTDINNIKLEEDEQTETNKETVTGEAETFASQAESRIEEAGTEEEVDEVVEQIEDKIDEVNNQLSELDYLDSLNSGMRVVLKDGRNVLLSVVMHSGEQVSATQFSKPHVSSMYASYKGELINIMPEDVDLDATIRYNTPKSSEELAGDSSEYQDRSSQEIEAVKQIGTIIRERALSSVEGNEVTPLSMKDVKKILEGYSTLSDMSATDMQELVELAMTNETRNVALKYINSGKQKFGYDLILSMYNVQPLLNARDSTRFERQQYSTPTPFGYVMGQFVQSGKTIESVLEPSAGNGALTITFPSAIVHVNDIDERRLENLRTLGYGKVTNQDALVPFSGEVDAVLTNPPFGSTTAREFDDGQIKISSLEGLMAINALESMKDNGRAAIVIGGNTSYRDNGAMQSKDMRLFAYLYSHYNVVDVINLNGDMYKRNGTKYDVRIILINGRKKGPFKLIAPPVKSKARAEQVNSFEELYNRIQNDIRSLQQMGNLFDGTEGEPRTTDKEGSGTDNNVSDRTKPGGRRESVQADKGVRADNDMGSTENASVSKQRKPEGRKAENTSGILDNGNRSDAGSINTVQEQGRTDNGTDSGRISTNESVRTDSGDNTGRTRLSVNLTDEKVPYPNRSQSGTLMSVVPANQAQVLADSLANIGDVDQFLVDQLGYSSKDELFSYLAAEQIDSVSLAINQMNKGNGFIIGDMTGVGKGRQGAALIRYAVKKGYTPIYFTQKPALFSDNYRDLSDIGSGELRPFIIASDPKNAAITDAAGNVVHKLPSEKERRRVFDYILKNGKLPEEYDYVITTYSQINNGTKEYEAKEDGIQQKDKSYKKKSPSAADRSGQERRDVIQALSKGNIMILDESHTAGGSGGGSMYMQYIMPEVKGVTFLSATFAKRADNMPIYAMKTDLSKSGISPQDMIEAISQGGVTLQEIMSKQLVQSGQMIRRERSFQGVTIDWMQVSEEEDAVQRKQFDEVSSIFSDIRAFQKDYITPIVQGISEELSEEGGYSNLQQGTSELGVTNTPFASKMYNLVNQLLFSLKADAVANRVIENLKNGFKPVISFTNTMEGFLDDAPKDTPMDKVPNFSATLMRALDGVMRYTETNLKGEKVNKSFTVNDLSEAGQNRYYEIKSKIEHLSADLPISPMDAIKIKIQNAGYKVGEITGRTLEMVQDENGKYIIQNRKDRDKKSAARDFNNGQLDVLMVNKSGSTGISLHASPKFEDQRQRVMVFAQFQSDINDEVQMRGRIDRTGQKFRGKYEYIMSSIPAEQRLQMMFKAKLKSLDANTTSSQKSKFNEMEVVDYLNKYGDEVTWQYMIEHPELSEKLGDPLNMLSESREESNTDDASGDKKEGCAAKIARYLPFLPVKEQEEVFKEITDAYSVKIQLLNDAGENDLEITTMSLKAKTISKKIWKPGTEPNSGNAFADNTYLEEVEVDVLKKPMKAEEIRSTVKRMTSGENFDDWKEKKIKEMNSLYDEKIESLKKRLSQSAEERAEKAKKNYIAKSKEARENGKNEFTDEEIEKMSDVVVEDIMKKANESFIKQRNVIQERRDNILKQINSFTPMKPLVIPFNLDEAMATIAPSRGMFLGFKFSKDYSTSSSTAVFATLDGRRKVEIPLNQEKAFDSIRMNTMMQPTFLKDLNVDSWDSHVPTQTRKKSYVVTGNLLQALVDTKKSVNVKGYLVSYSTIEGDTKQGILLSDSFKPENLTTSAPISSRLIQIQQGETVVSEDKRVVVERNTGWRTGYALKVPKSKKQGGEFFEDNKLRSLADNKEFTTRGNYMVADISSDNLPEALDRLSKMGVTVSKKAKLENASDVRFREEDAPRSIVDPFIQELMMRFQGEDISRYLYVDVRKDPNADYEVYWGYSEPLYKGKNVENSEEVPELIKDIIRDNDSEIDKQDIIDNLNSYIEFNEGFEEAEEGQKILDWFKENMNDFKMSDKVNVITERGELPDNLYREVSSVKSDIDYNENEAYSSAEKLNVPLQVVTSTEQISDPSVKSAIESGRKIKGWFSVSEGKVYVYLPNASGIEDVKQTILHEGVAHYGLRKLVGDERMDDFLDEVFRNVSKEIRNKIVGTLPKYGYDSRVATEEYLARMAESGVDVSTWERIKQAFKNLLRRIGINIQINDNELKYILWRSAQNLDKNRPIDLAIDVAMQYNMGVGNYFREGESDGSREEYENSLQGWKYKAREAYQDSMLALKNLQEVIANVSGKPIKSFEDAYKAENQLSSKNTAEAEEYYEKFFKPMLEAEGKMMKNYGLSHKEIERYMMLAHGIERNVEMTFREMLNEIINTNPNDAQQFADDFIMERDRLRNMYSGYEYLKALSDYIGEVGDFSATEAILTSIDNEEHTDFQNDALEYVKDFESKYDTSVLWDKTNRATKETLKKTYESGMMDKDHFANVSKMFMYYVPLRGWNEKTAEDVYEYINSERSPLNSVLKSMKGRKSVPDEVMATIGNMAESAILQGNKNLMKQSFMNMVMNHPTDVATMRKAWYIYDQAKDEWTISMPELQDNDTPEIISQKISDHEEKMKSLKEKGLATQKSSGLNIDYRILKNNISQHAVVVKNGGKDYIIYVNGNPRAAQAVNGLTNPDAEKNPIFNSISRANRWLAANFTTRNPAFVMSNLARDMIFSMSAIGIKEDAKYSAKFRKNLFVSIPTVFDCIRGKCKNSQSDMYFKEFVKNGGETGYMHLNDVDKYKKKVKKELSKITGERGSAKAALDYTLERLEDFNRWAEDVSRFAVYMTSRQMGRSIVDSVNDAKEVTVNFNKKGAGYKTGGFFGITAGIMRNLYLFFNASAQSLSNFNRLRVKNPVRFYSTLGGFIAAGVIMPVINDFLYNVLGGGDDNPYNDLPEWVRRNNLCIYAGNGQFVTIPLPIELRAFYGLGDYAYQLSIGREKPTPTGLAKGTVSQLADLLPLNPTGNEGFKTFMPDALSPIFETYVWNEDFTGKPIAKLTPFNERDPEWKRVYKGTSGWLVDASKFFNDLTNGGGPGSDFRKGFIDFNPAKVENLLESYFGGMAKFLNQSGKTIYYGAKSMAEGEMDENLVARNVPIVNRFYNKVDDRNAFSGINTEYFNLRDEMEQFKYELNGVKKNYRNNPEEYRQIVNSDMFRKYMRYKPYQDRLDRLYKMAKELEGQERKQVEDMIIEIRRELVNSLK
jgi:predicted RNA methylase